MSFDKTLFAATLSLGCLALAGSAHAQTAVATDPDSGAYVAPQATTTTTTYVATPASTTYVAAPDEEYEHHHHHHHHHDHEHRTHRPRLMYGIEGGVGTFVEDGPFGFNNGTGAAVGAGPAWGARVGMEFLPFLAVEARYLGMYNQGNSRVSAGGTVGMVTNSGSVVLRLTAPFPYVHPYVFGGVGYYDTRLTGSETARQGSTLTASREWGVPMGVGIDVPVCDSMSVGVEGTYHLLQGESFSTSEAYEGGDPLTTTLVIRGRL